MEVDCGHSTLVPRELTAITLENGAQKKELYEAHFVQEFRALDFPDANHPIGTTDSHAPSTVFFTPSPTKEGVFKTSRSTMQGTVYPVRR